MDDDRPGHSRQHEWRKHGPKRARLHATVLDLQAAAELEANRGAAQLEAAAELEANQGAAQLEVSVDHDSDQNSSIAVSLDQDSSIDVPLESSLHVSSIDSSIDVTLESNLHVSSVADSSNQDLTFNEDSIEITDNGGGSDSDSSSICDMEMHYLEEGPVNNEHDLHHADDPADPEDPDDPHVDGSSDEESEDSDLENEDQENFDFSNVALNTPIVMERIPTVREVLLLDLAQMVRHKQTYECIIDAFESKNVALGKKYFPTSKKELWRILGRNNSGITEHIYCSSCGSYIGKKKRQGVFSSCPNPGCDFRIETSKAKYFVTLSLKSQLRNFFQTPGVAELLTYRETRTKHQEGSIEDVYDSKCYQELNLGPNDFSGVLNTDGCKIRKGAKLEIYPVFFRLNELPPLLRQRFMFLSAVFVDVNEPKMTTLLQPVVDQLNNLSEVGVDWIKNGVQVQSKIKVSCFCVDGKARHQVLNMSTHQSRYGCTYCTIRGVPAGESNTMRWPILPNPEIPPFEDRTNEGMINAILQVQQAQGPVLGHKGPTPLMLLEGFDLRKGNACDDLHVLYECAAKHFTEIVLTEADARVNEHMGTEALCAIIDQRMQKIKTPTNISRKPGTCKMINRKSFKGSEWRNWIIYYAVPCLKGLIKQEYITPIEFLSHGSFLLSQDIIMPEDTVQAEQCFNRFLELNEELGGLEKTKLNLHTLIHFGRSVRDHGNLWCYSTFNFESWNHKIIKTVSSPKGVLLQIVVRHLILTSLELAQREDNISAPIRAQLSKILNKKRMTRAHHFSPHLYLMGKFIMRDTSIEEQQVLQRRNFQNVVRVQEYKKININSTAYCPMKHVKDDGKSDNSLVYTYGDTFCSIQSVVRFQTADGIDNCGLFVSEHGVTNCSPFNEARHIACLLERDNDLPYFILPKEIRSPVVKIPLHGEMYLIPLTNLNEID